MKRMGGGETEKYLGKKKKKNKEEIWVTHFHFFCYVLFDI